MLQSSALEKMREKTTPKWTNNLDVNDFASFGNKYIDDPCGFVTECIAWKKAENEHPTDYQLDILSTLNSDHRLAVRAGHGSGKSCVASWSVLHFALTREALGIDWKVVTTASAWRQLIHYLWPEIHKWAMRINWHTVGRGEFIPKEELSTRRISLRHGSAFPVASNRSDLIEGAHADHMLYVFDESKVIPEATWVSAEGAMVSETAWWLAISTPGEPVGKFYHIHVRREGTEDWTVRHVKMEEALRAGRLSEKWVEDRKKEWGENSSIFQNRVLGEFAESEEDNLIPLSWVEAAIERWKHWNRDNQDVTVTFKSDQLGVDVARGGADKSVIAKRVGYTITELQKYNYDDTMELAGRVAPLLAVHSPSIAYIDVVGLGAGVYDRLSEQFSNRVYSFHPQEKTDFRDAADIWEFKDVYSAAWWNIRELLDPSNPRKLEKLAAIPPDDQLLEELTAVKYSYRSDGKIQVEPKEKTKEVIGRSPDTADAVVMAFWEPVEHGIEFA